MRILYVQHVLCVYSMYKLYFYSDNKKQGQKWPISGFSGFGPKARGTRMFEWLLLFMDILLTVLDLVYNLIDRQIYCNLKRIIIDRLIVLL